MQNTPRLQVISNSVTLTSTGNTTLFTTENGTRRFIIVGVNVEVTTANTVTIPGTLSVGQTSASYADILAAAALTGLTAVNKLSLSMGATLAAGQVSIAANTPVVARVSIASTATTHVARVDVLGYYI